MHVETGDVQSLQDIPKKEREQIGTPGSNWVDLSGLEADSKEVQYLQSVSRKERRRLLRILEKHGVSAMISDFRS